MPPVKGPWSREQLRQFLEEALMPLRIGCRRPSGGLWMLSLWYTVEDDQFLCATSSDSDIAEFLRADDAVCFELSTNRPPYMGVRGNGTASLEPDEDKALLRDLLDRYLGGTESELADMLLDDDREELVIRVRPDRLYTWDFTDRMRAARTETPAGRRPEPESPRYD
ncbi:pyridoxamine 5'-phosphate oxidase family protein [Halovenus sp. WSH3]|uniref:Pyridoxamine 5'-phosphate oxidase family protein n=1 Tax=Halovenus carboxidivorans TaxID=2692199 RepID=A0A6B0T6G7_9EURY|nr:pyridoxamine 5'-phosphate oxidase family protein [Halovenus carboxidivorans]MXR50872.1 pyridoxamine 5'-phosphate oxidase family protein [Halovenus carboxidivorans]